MTNKATWDQLTTPERCAAELLKTHNQIDSAAFHVNDDGCGADADDYVEEEKNSSAMSVAAGVV